MLIQTRAGVVVNYNARAMQEGEDMPIMLLGTPRG